MVSKLITSKVSGPVQQQIHYDPVSAKIEVVHYFNLKNNEDVILSKIEKFVMNNKSVKKSLTEKVLFEKLSGGKITRYGTRFLYKIVPGQFSSNHARKFPEKGTSYPLSHLPHHVEVMVM